MNINVSGNYTLSLSAETFLTNTKKIYLQCQTSLGAVNITLPRISTAGGTWGFEVYVNDIDGNASVNNITVTSNAADGINGSASPVVINTNGGNGAFEIISRTDWAFSLGNSNAVPAVDYKRYVALLTQSGVNPPTAIVLVNTLGGVPVWSYSSPGVYIGTLAGAFTSNKTFNIIANVENVTVVSCTVPNVNEINVKTNGSDSILIDTSIEIVVYD